MLKIESKDFYPIEGDKDFKVVLKVPSFSEYQDIEIEAGRHLPSGGPVNKSSDALYLKTRVQKLFEFAVVSVHGCELNGKAISNHEDLFKHAPQKIILSILDEINKLAVPSEAEIKN